MGIKDIAKKIKIEPIIESKDDFSRNHIVGFRGVRENLGVTTLLSHIAVEVAGRGFTVCVVDLDFQTPNVFFSKNTNYTILDKLNNASQNVMTIVNKTQYRNLSYVGALPQEAVPMYLPLVEDEKFIEDRKALLGRMFEDLETKFELILVDIPSDIRLAEAVIGLQNSKLVLTVSNYDYPCTTRLLKDNLLLTDVIPQDRMYDIVNVSTPFIQGAAYNNIDSRIKVVADVYLSKSVFDDAYELKLDRNRIGNNIVTGARDTSEHKYYKGIKDIIDFMKGGRLDGGQGTVHDDEPSEDVVGEHSV